MASAGVTESCLDCRPGVLVVLWSDELVRQAGGGEADWETQWGAGLQIVREVLLAGKITWHL